MEFWLQKYVQCAFVEPLLRQEIPQQSWHDMEVTHTKVRPQNIFTGLFGNFLNMGEGVFPIPKTFLDALASLRPILVIKWLG